MADFRKWLFALAVAALLVGSVPTASAQPGGYACVATAVPFDVRQEGLSELVGDIVLQCSPSASAAFSLNISVTALVGNFSNRFTTDPQVDALLFSNDALAGVALATRVSNTNYTWLGASIAAPGTVIRIKNLRMNVAGLAENTPVQVFISVQGAATVSVTNPQLTVAFVRKGLKTFDVRDEDTEAQCQDVNKDQFDDPTKAESINKDDAGHFRLRYEENFGSAFKLRLEGSQLTSSQGISEVVFSESGFVNSGLTGSGATGTVGVATQATRLIAKFSGIPANVKLFVYRNQVDSSPGSLTATLVSTDVDGAGGTAPTTFPAQEQVQIPVLSDGTASAVWEVFSASGITLERVDFEAFIAFKAGQPGAGTIKVAGSYAPLSTVTGSSSTAPVPRFTATLSSQDGEAVAACRTTLLFPFLAAIPPAAGAPGWDTGIAISNTSADPIKSGNKQSGKCTLNWFKNDGTSTAETSGTVEAGKQLIFTLSGGTTAGGSSIAAKPDWIGYLIAQCDFRFGHGFAFISDMGANRLSHGYLALVMEQPGKYRPDTTGEGLTQ